IVVTFLLATCETGVEQERIGLPSTCTVQAPHSPAPQPNFVPVSWSVSRRTQRSGVSGETETCFSLPLTRSVMSAMVVQYWDFQSAVHVTQVEGKVEWASNHTSHFSQNQGELARYPNSNG